MTPVAFALLFSEFRKLSKNFPEQESTYVSGLTGKISQFMRDYNPVSKIQSSINKTTVDSAPKGIDLT